MNTKYYNEAFAEKYGHIKHTSKPLKESFATELKTALDNRAMNLAATGTMNIKEYEIAFQDEIEKMVPDKSWWEVTDLNIFYDLFENKDIQGCVDRIIDELKPEYKDVQESLDEAANPENAEINALIRDIVSTDKPAGARAKKKLAALGYEVSFDDSARREFGRGYFGDKIRVYNPTTGREIYADVGKNYTGDTLIAKNGNVGGKQWTKLKGYNGRQYTHDKDAVRDFDYKNFLDTARKQEPEAKSTVQQYKDDKKFIKDNEYTINKGIEAKDRMSAVKDKLAKFRDKKQERLDEDINFNMPTSEILLGMYEESFVGEFDTFEQDFKSFRDYIINSLDKNKTEYKKSFEEKKAFDAEQEAL